MLYTAEHNTRRSEQRIDSPLFRKGMAGNRRQLRHRRPRSAQEQTTTEQERLRSGVQSDELRRKHREWRVISHTAKGSGHRSCMQAMVGVAQDARMQPMPRKFRYIEFIAYEVPVTISGDWMILTDGEWCPREESNLHALRHTVLSRACLPFHHSG